MSHWCLLILVWFLIMKSLGESVCKCGYGSFCPIFSGEEDDSDCYCKLSEGLYEPEHSPGTGCNELKNHCASAPCPDGVTCIPSFGSYSCQCQEHYFGQKCDIDKRHVTGVKSFAKNVMVFFDIREQTSGGQITVYLLLDSIGDKFTLELDDGGGYVRTQSDVSFIKGNAFKTCQNHMRNIPGSNQQVCQRFAPNRVMHIGQVSFKYPVIGFSHRNAFLSKRHMLIGRLDTAILKVRNGDKIIHESKFKIFTYFDFKSTFCTVSPQLKQCSSDSKKPVLYKRTSSIVLRSVNKPLHGTYCKRITEISHEWRIKGQGIDRKISSVSVARLPKSEGLNFGTYTVEYTVNIYGATDLGMPQKHYINFERCWLKIGMKPIVAIIKGGSERVVPRNKKLKLDGSLSKDPNHFDNNRLKFVWTCNNPSLRFCNRKGPKERGSEMLLGGLNTGEVIFTLTVYSDFVEKEFFANATQKIIVSTPDVFSEFNIVCKKNCLHPNNKEIIYLELEHYPVGQTIDWKYWKDGGSESDATSIREPQTPGHQLIVKKGVLDEGSTYFFKASQGNTHCTFKLEMSDPIHPGTCSVNPRSGTAGNTKFTVGCENFNGGKDRKLSYEVYEVHGTMEILMVTSFYPKMPDLLFTSGNLKVRVKDEYGGAFLEQSMSITLKPDSTPLSPDELEKKMDKLRNKVQGEDISNTIATINHIATKLETIENKNEATGLLVNYLLKVKHYEISDAIQLTGCLAHLLSKTINTSGESFIGARTVKDVVSSLRTMTKTTLESIPNAEDFMEVELQSFSRLILGAVDPVLSSRDKKVTDSDGSVIDHEAAYTDYRLTTPELLSCIEDIGDTLVSCMLPGQEPVTISSGGDVTIQAKVARGEDLAHGGNLDPGGTGQAYVSFEPGFSNAYAGKVIELQATELKKNPVWWKKSEIDISSSCMNVKMRTRQDTRATSMTVLKEPIDIFLQVHGGASVESIKGSVIRPEDSLPDIEKDKFVALHKLDRARSGSVLIFLEFADIGTNQLLVLMLKNELPDFETIHSRGVLVNSAQHIYESSVFKQGTDEDFIYIGILPTKQHNVGEKVNYEFKIHDATCPVWQNQDWDSGICEVSEATTSSMISCNCRHLSLISGSLMVPPTFVNPITDLKLFKTLRSNPYVLVMVVTILTLYIGIFIWAYKMDKKDLWKRRIHLLPDNLPGDKYCYLLTVFTGERSNSGTSSNVGIRIFGSNGYSHAHILNFDKRLLQVGQDNWFAIYTDKHLGEIEHLHIWHDNSGTHPDWYCHKIFVYDLTWEEHYFFKVENWLSVSTLKREDWRLEWNIKPEKMSEERWQTLAMENFFTSLRETHLWFSIFVRHPRSEYTRKQRLTVGVVILMITMLSSIMFYGAAEASYEDNPSYSISIRELIIVLQVMIISSVTSIVAAKLFELSRQYNKKNVVNTQGDQEKEITKKEGRRKRFWAMLSEQIINFVTMDPLLPVQMDPYAPLTKEQKTSKKIFLYVAWIVNISIILICSFFLILYGLKFGPNKSLLWLSVVLVNLGKAIFLTQPIKVAVLALLVTFFLKISNREKLTYRMQPTGVDENLKNDPKFMAELIERRSQPMYHPLDPLEIGMAVKKRKVKEMYKWSNINFVFVFVLYLIILTVIITIGAHSSYFNTQHLYNMIEMPEKRDDIDLRMVHTKESFLKYMVDTLIPSLHKTKWYNGNELPREEREEGLSEVLLRGWTSDYVHKLVGIPRIRQHRIMNLESLIRESAIGTALMIQFFENFFKCPPILLRRCQKYASCSVIDELKEWYPYGCNISMTSANVETDSFSEWWKKKEPLNWYYQTPGQSESNTLFGASHYFYPGGGYARSLSHTKRESTAIIARLNLTSWIDEKTRLLVVGLNLYNVNCNLFTYVQIIFECLPSGVYLSRTYVNSAYHEFFQKIHGIKSTTILGFLIAILILSIIRGFITVSVRGVGSYFKQWGNIIDVLIILFGVLSIFGSVLRVTFFKFYTEELESSQDNETFISFANPFYQNDLVAVLLGIFLFLTTLRLISLLHYGKYFYVARRTLLEALPYIVLIYVLTIIITTLIAVLMYLTRIQHTVIFPALPFPRYHFLRIQREAKLQDGSLAFSIVINTIFCLAGLLTVCILTFLHRKSTHQMLVYGLTERRYTNRLYDILKGLKKGIGIMIGVSRAKRLNLRGGGSWYSSRTTRTFNHNDFKKRSERGNIYATANDVIEKMARTITRNEKMSRQLESLINYVSNENQR